MIQVRPLWMGELPDVVELVVALMEAERWKVTEDTRGAIALSLMPSEQTPVFVAHDGEKPVGMIQLKWNYDVATGQRLEAFRFYVKPDYRTQGVGYALIKAVIDALPPDMEVDIYISTVGPLRRSFKRLGFDTVSLIHVAPLAKVREALRH